MVAPLSRVPYKLVAESRAEEASSKEPKCPTLNGELFQGPGPQNQAPKTDIELLWDQGLEKDSVYGSLRRAVKQKQRTFLANLGIKASIAECSTMDGKLTFRERL